MSVPALFDVELLPLAWFDPELDDGVWFDEVFGATAPSSAYFETTEFQIRANGGTVLGADVDTWYDGLSLEFCTVSRGGTAIKLTSLRRDVGSGQELYYTLEIPAIAYLQNDTQADSANLDNLLKIFGLRVGENEDGHDWKVTWSSMEWWLDGGLVDTIVAGTLYSDTSGVEGIPLIGIKPVITTLLNTSPGLPTPVETTGTAFDRTVSLDFTAGYRYKDGGGAWVEASRVHEILDPPANPTCESGPFCCDAEPCFDSFSDKVATPCTTWEVTGTAEHIVREVALFTETLCCECPPECPGPCLEYDIWQYTAESHLEEITLIMPTPGFDPAEYNANASNICGCLPEETQTTESLQELARTWDADEILWCMGVSIAVDSKTYPIKVDPESNCGPCPPPEPGEPPHSGEADPCWVVDDWHCCSLLYSCATWADPTPGDGGVTSDVSLGKITNVYWTDSLGEVQGARVDNAGTEYHTFSTGIFADYVHVKIDRRPRVPRIRLYTSESGACYVRTSVNGGVAFGAPVALGDGETVTSEISYAGLEYVYRNDGGTIKGRRYDRAGNALEAEFTAASGADSGTGITVISKPVEGGANQLVLRYLVGGAVTTKTSIDGVTFV